VDNEAISRSQRHARQRSVERSRLMGKDVVAHVHDGRWRLGTLQPARYRCPCRRPEGHPPGQDDNLWLEAGDSSGNPQPGQRIERIKQKLGILDDRLARWIAIILAGKEPARILAFEGDEQKIVFVAQLSSQQGRVMSDAAAERVSWSDNCHAHLAGDYSQSLGWCLLLLQSLVAWIRDG